MTLLVVLDIERCVQEGEVREQALCGYAARQTEQIIVRIARIVVHAFLDLKDVNREDRGLAVAQTCLGGEQNLLDD